MFVGLFYFLTCFAEKYRLYGWIHVCMCWMDWNKKGVNFKRVAKFGLNTHAAKRDGEGGEVNSVWKMLMKSRECESGKTEV